MRKFLKLDVVGEWSEDKLDIVKKYTKSYSTILSAQQLFSYIYIDAFAGAGIHISRETGLYIPGSPLNALQVQPQFSEYHFIDIDSNKVELLRSLVANRNDVHIHQGNCNRVLIDKIFPLITYESYKRALCILDPYGMQLDWAVIEAAGKLKTLDVFINFPILDINRNALRKDQRKVTDYNATRFTRLWGDESWRDIAFRPSKQRGLFEDENEKIPNEELVDAFCSRLTDVAEFDYVADPIDMRNAKNATLYYLLFASQKSKATKIVRDITSKNRKK